jgi:NTP pyrophosphatase (non-canonical NTP hydrolase)
MVDFSEYQKAAAKTAIYPDRGKPVGLMYAALGAAGEGGEIADKVKKLWRDHGAELTPEFIDALDGEIGDELWYLAEIATHIQRDLGEIAARNIAKLYSRKERGVLGGSGDNR